MLQFAEEPRPLVILDEHGHPLSAGDNARRFFEVHGCTSTTGNIIFLILRETLICFAMPQEIIRMVRSLIKGYFAACGRLDYSSCHCRIQRKMVSVSSRLCPFGGNHLVA